MEAFFLLIGLVIGVLVVWMVPRRVLQRTAAIIAEEARPTGGAPSGPGQQEIPASGGDDSVLKQELERVRMALDALPVGVVYVDESGRVMVRNRMAEHAAGARHGDILVDEALEVSLRAAVQGEVRDQSLDLFGPPHRVLSIHTEPVMAGGAIATISDITERARLDAVRTDFVANISHELKTPVGAISLLAETLADADDRETAERLAGKLVKESERLTRTIEDLLELSRIELGGDAMRERVSARAVIDEALDRVRGIAESRSIRIIVSAAAERLAVMGDRRQLVSALGNLVENAIKYSDQGADVEVGAEESSGAVVFTVTDHGMGIASQHLDRIFERFYRVDKARSRDTGGVGLGLAIVRHVAANHGGEVNVISREGEGSTFRLKIPCIVEKLSMTHSETAVVDPSE